MFCCVNIESAIDHMDMEVAVDAMEQPHSGTPADGSVRELPALICVRPTSPGGGSAFRLGALPPSGCSSLEDLDDTVEGTTIYQLSCDNHYNLNFYANRCDSGSDAGSMKNFKNHPTTVWVKR